MTLKMTQFWPPYSPPIDHAVIVFRRVVGISVSDWRELEGLESKKDIDLWEFLFEIYGTNPRLQFGTTFDPGIMEDRFGYQYWGVERTNGQMEARELLSCQQRS